FSKILIWWFITILFLFATGTSFYFLYESGLGLGWVILISFYSINLLFSLVVFIQVRQEAGKLSWMMAFLLMPYLGHAIFALFGQRYKFRKSNKEYKDKKSFSHEKIKFEKGKNITSNILNQQSSISKRGIYSVDIEVISNGNKGYKKMFDDIESAEKFILIEYYIFKPGEIFDQFKDILIRKAKSGVEVKIIVDDFGRWAVPRSQFDEFEENGVKVRMFGEVHFPFIGSYNGYRLHRKIVIVDGKTIHTGGINIANEYAGLNNKFGMWMDYQVKITGESVNSYSLIFIDDWETVCGEELEPIKYLTYNHKKGKSNMVVIEDSPENTSPIMQDSIINMISNAKKEIIITSPYFVPTPELFSSLRIAAMSGVKVKIFLPGKPDKKVVIIASRHFAKELMKYGVEVFEATNLLIHSKIGVFDGKYAYVGTANLDVRTLYAQWEVIQLITGKAVEDIKELMDSYIQKSRKMKYEEFKASLIKRILVRIYINLLSPIM
ncbi:MAG: cardiolipin synthase, partial [Mycoplasmataceae bacterium]|nr:cardiolipin synthase [Mycoplasmataceae bacterium]